jgi:hypothetical protein
VQYVCQQEFPKLYRRKTAVPSRINLLSNRTSTIKWSHGIVMRIAVREKETQLESGLYYDNEHDQNKKV